MGFGFGNGWIIDWLVVVGHAMGCYGCDGLLIKPCLFDYCLMLLGIGDLGLGLKGGILRWYVV